MSIPRPEHPRPQFARAQWLNLNGAWAFQRDPGRSGRARGLAGDAICIEARMMAIADIYDALTASDRPYKKAVPHEIALRILADEAREQKIDGDLLAVFRESDVPRRVLGVDAVRANSGLRTSGLF